jgi:cell wall-associated NlpC family hydrolase
MKKLIPVSVFAVVLSASLFLAATGQKVSEPVVDTMPKVAIDSSKISSPLADSIVEFGKSFMGLHYHYTGKTPATGFDCSGFTSYIFGHFGIELSPASKEQIFAGTMVPLAKVKKGDLLIFTGTRVSVREPGHVGIVVSNPGELPVRFVHSSSNGGVKISEVQGTRYADRLLEVRRLF